MAQNFDFDLAIIGAGPGGYVAALRAGQVGLKTVIIEKEYLGGMCLNWGCIPVKALLESAKLYRRIQNARQFGITGIDRAKVEVNWPMALERAHRVVHQLSEGIAHLLRKNDIEMITAEARIKDPHTINIGPRDITAENIIIATGSVPDKYSDVLHPEMVMGIRELFKIDKLPGSICVYGAGPHTLELVELLGMLDKKVTLVCPDSHILSIADPVLTIFAEKKLADMGITMFMESEITGAYNGGVMVGDEKIPCDIVLNSSHRKAVLPPMDIQLELQDGFIKVDSKLRTNFENIYAIGDVNGLGILAHVASDQGIKAVNIIKGIKDELDLAHIPLNIYSHPEISQVGLTEPQVKEKGIPYRVSQFPLYANGKALAEGDTDGFIRLISGEKYGEILGVQIVAAHATDMIAEAGAVMTMEGTIYDLTRILHAHPTVSEVYTEIGYVASGEPIHI